MLSSGGIHGIGETFVDIFPCHTLHFKSKANKFSDVIKEFSKFHHKACTVNHFPVLFCVLPCSRERRDMSGNFVEWSEDHGRYCAA